MAHSPTKAQWGLNQVASRYDQSPTKTQWDASITLRAIQSESLPLRGTSPNRKYSIPNSIPSPTSTSSFQQHHNQSKLQPKSSSTPGSSDTGNTNSSYSTLNSKNTLISSLHSSTSSSNHSAMYSDQISPRTVIPPKPFMERTTSKKENINLNKYTMSIDTVKAQKLLSSSSSSSNALGVYRNVQELSPTSTRIKNKDDGYWQGGDSPNLLKGIEPPLMYSGSSTSLSQKGSIKTPRATITAQESSNYISSSSIPSSLSNQNKFDPIEIIEQEARALLQARYQGFSNSKPPITMKQQEKQPQIESKEMLTSTKPLILSNELPKKVRINPDQPSEIRSSGKVKSSDHSSSSSSFFRKAFKNNSPYKQQQQQVIEKNNSSSSIKDSENIATKRSIMRHSQSANLLHSQYHHNHNHLHQRNQSSSTNNLSRMISAPILMETSSTASPVLNSSSSSRGKLSTVSSTRETIEAFEQVRNEIRKEEDYNNDERQSFIEEKPKRYQRRPAPPPPPRRRQRSSTGNSPVISPLSTSTTNSSISNRSPFTPTDLPVSIEDQKLINRNNTANEYFSSNSSIPEISPLLYVKEVGKERNNSNANSIQSTYDQESWLGHSPKSQSKQSLPLKEKEEEEEEKGFEIDSESESSFDEEPIPVIFSDSNEEKRPSSSTPPPPHHQQKISNSPFETTRRPSIPTHYKIVRTSDDDSKEFEKIDSILLYEEGDEDELDLTDDESLVEFTSFTVTKDEEDKDKQVGKEEIKILERKPSSSIRESGYFDLNAMAQHTQPIRNKWSNKETGKLNTFGMILTTASSTLAYISPIQFKEIHGVVSTENELNNSSKGYDKLDDEKVQNVDESLKGNSRRLLLSAVPMYENIFKRLWQISHWNNRKDSFLWCLSYFTLWYFNALIPGLLTILIVKIVNGKKYRTLSQKNNLTKLNQLRSNSSSSKSNSSSLNSSPTLNGEEEIQPESIKFDEHQELEAIEALRRYEQLMVKFTANTADIHERIQNMSKWARKPATMRSLIILSILVLSSFFMNANDLVRLTGLLFGLFFFFFNPIFSIFKSLQRFKKSSSSTKTTNETTSNFNLIDFFLAGVPNDAENEILINNRKRLAQEEKEKEEQEKQKLQKNRISNKIVIQPDHARSMVKEESKIIPLMTRQQNKGRTFKATYGEEEIDENRFGLLTISTERLLFTNQSPSFEVLVNVSLDQIVQIDKVRRGGTISDNGSSSSYSSQNEGLRILVVKDKDNKKVDFHTFLNMNSRDEAFDRILSSVPNQWRKHNDPHRI